MTARAPGAFSPYPILHALEDARVEFVLIGALARVLHGADETTAGVDPTASPRQANLERLERALASLDTVEETEERAAPGVTVFSTPAGAVRCVETPLGTRGYPDLRRKAGRLHLGEGLRPQVAGPGDLVRMLEALGRPEHEAAPIAMRGVLELDRGLERGI